MTWCLGACPSQGEAAGQAPKLSDKQQRELCRMHQTVDYSIRDLADHFSVSPPTVYRTMPCSEPGIKLSH